MLTLLLGTDWIANRDAVLKMISQDVSEEKGRRILIVPELISHDTERRLCAAAGDTASRFAEVLSFTRLAGRVFDAAGHGAQVCLDNGGRVVAMAAAARQMHSRLKAYASVETRPEFLIGLVDAVDEFKRCCISCQDLLLAAKKTEGSLAQKLEELSLLLESYDALCQRGKRDPRDQMVWLLEQLEDSDFAQQHVFYIDGFPDFTRQHAAILEHLIINAQQVVISMNCDAPGSELPGFERAGATATELIRYAKTAGVPVQIVTVPFRTVPVQDVREHLFLGKTEVHGHLAQRLRVYQTDTVYEECLSAAEQIMTLVRGGARYRDISVVCTDMGIYRNTVRMVFARCKIPVYLSGTEDILDRSAITTVLAAMDAALGGFEQREVIRYLKSMLSPLESEIGDRLENYAILWNINGNRWLKEWTNHPEGLGEEWSEASRQELAELNAARSASLEPLAELYQNFQDAKNVKQQVQALYRFLDRIRLAERLAQLADSLDAAGDNANAQILNQLWEILLTALEQMYDTLGETAWDQETFTRLFRLLLSQYDVGTIPPVLDSVMVGPVSAMRCQQAEHLFVLGALEGALPGYSGAAGVLTDQERAILRQMGVPLNGGAMEGLQTAFSEIYGVFCGAQQTVCISCPAGQPSFIYRRLRDMAGGEQPVDILLGAARADRIEAGAFLVSWNDQEAAAELGLLDTYMQINNCRNHHFGTVEAVNIQKLYGARLNLSASQVDRLAECRFSYFMKYGLRVKERKSASVDPAEFGTYVHAVLEQTGREIMELGGFRQVTMETTLEIARKHSQAYAQARFSELDSERLSYLFRRNGQELEMVVQELWQELQDSRFAPVDFEVAFGNGGLMDAISIAGHQMDAQLRGFVDRVDVCQIDGRIFFRVVDYKTGRKDFDYCDIFNGLGLQMLLYLFALQDGGMALLGDAPVPAGVQYFPARAPMVSADGVLTQEEAVTAREKAWKRKGLLLLDEDVLNAMEPNEKPKRLNYTRRKDGSISGDVADSTQFMLLKAYVFCLLGNMVDQIASGYVEPNPYTRGTSHDACAFCPYGAVCHQASVEGRRNYKAMSAQQFWEEIGKEMKKRG